MPVVTLRRTAAARAARPRLPLLLTMLVSAACAGDADRALDEVRRDGIRAGFAVEPPYAFVDSSGRVTGEAPEALRVAAREAGIPQVQWVPLEFEQLIPALRAGRIDVIAAGMFVTPERERRVRFSRSTVCVRPVLVRAAAGHERNAERSRPAPQGESGSCEDCRIAVLNGSVEQRALESEAVGLLEPVVVPDLGTGIAAVLDGTADALAISAPTARALIGDDPRLRLDEEGLADSIAEAAAGCAALAFRVGDEALAAALDSTLEEFVGSPAHAALTRRFGFTGRELP